MLIVIASVAEGGMRRAPKSCGCEPPLISIFGRIEMSLSNVRYLAATSRSNVDVRICIGPC